LNRSRFEFWIREELVGPVIRALQPLLYVLAFTWRRALVRTTVIGITGSLGKTTAKESLADTLTIEGLTFRSYQNQNSPAMVALNILRIRPWHRYAVIEAAGSSRGMMKKSAHLLRPDVAIVLNVRRTHSKEFLNMDEYAAEKSELLAGIKAGGTAVLNADDPLVSAMPVPEGVHVHWFGVTTGADYQLGNVSALWPQRLSFVFHHDGQTRQIQTQLVGDHWLTSAGAVLTATSALGVNLENAVTALRAAEPFAARLQPLKLPSGAIILRDDNNGSIDTIESSMKVLGQATADRKLLVITDMTDFGSPRRRHRLKYLGSLAAATADIAVFIGIAADRGVRAAIAAGMPVTDAHAFASLRAAAEFLRRELRQGDLVLLKGRATDHTARLFFAQLGDVTCWKDYCKKTMLCDTCWELGISRKEAAKAKVVRVPR
jgi:UDP-N-acetylmuramoyl-tripeptide--D-alanyl-D-alanine ligase